MHEWGGVGHAGPGSRNLDGVGGAGLIVTTRDWQAVASCEAARSGLLAGALRLYTKVRVFVSRHVVLGSDQKGMKQLIDCTRRSR